MEASLLQSNLKEMEIAELDLKAKVDNATKEQEATQHKASTASEATGNALLDAESLINLKAKDLEEKKGELKLLEDKVQRLDSAWSLVEEESLKTPSPAQREKVLEKQLHSLIEQLTAKQAQAERLITDIHGKEKDLERLNSIHRNLHSSSSESRSRFSGGLLSGDEDPGAKGVRVRPGGARTEGQRRLMALRSAFVLYILALHVVVFIKISVSS
uniref:Uncharacterized protein n=1 Tax=Avena sativa TaxID=4498 RepID=A0ACD5VA50_AVESA